MLDNCKNDVKSALFFFLFFFICSSLDRQEETNKLYEGNTKRCKKKDKRKRNKHQNDKWLMECCQQSNVISRKSKQTLHEGTIQHFTCKFDHKPIPVRLLVGLLVLPPPPPDESFFFSFSPNRKSTEPPPFPQKSPRQKQNPLTLISTIVRIRLEETQKRLLPSNQCRFFTSS